MYLFTIRSTINRNLGLIAKGASSKDPTTDRVSELNQTGVPQPFKVEYYSLVENESSSPSTGYYDCYVSNAISETIEETSDTLKEVTLWKAFNDNEKHLIKPGNYAYYRNGALFICDNGGNVLKQLGNTIDENAYDNPNSYYILKDNEKKCYGSRYSDIQ